MDMNENLKLEDAIKLFKINNKELGKNISAAISNEPNNALKKLNDGNFVEDLSYDIEKIKALATTYGSELAFAQFGSNVDVTVSTGSIIPFNVTNANNAEFVNNAGIISGFKKGHSYYIEAGGTVLNSNSRTDAKLINNRTSVEFGNRSINAMGAGNGCSAVCTGFLECKDNEDTISLKCILGTNSQLSGAFLFFNIYEVGRSILIDPMNAKGQYKFQYGEICSSTTGNVAANTPIVFDTIKSGNVTIGTNGGVILNKEKTYKIDLIGIFRSTIITALKVNLYDCNSGAAIDNYSFENVSLTASSHWIINNSSILIDNISEDIEVSIIINKAIVIDSNNNISIIVTEVAQPMICEYTKHVDVHNDLANGVLVTDAPVGNVINCIDAIAIPDHYLPRDGRILNIADYQEIADAIKSNKGSYNYYGGDGVTTFAISPKNTGSLKKVSPILTSNNTPSPYVVTASSTQDSGYEVWHLFDGIIQDGSAGRWCTDTGVVSGNIVIDMGNPTLVSVFKLYSEISTRSSMIKDFTIEGSNDNTNYTVLKTVTGETNWSTPYKNYELDSYKEYRYYKIAFTSNNGHTRVSLLEVEMFAPDIKEYVKYESTTYAVNQYGGFYDEVLFEGAISAVNTTTGYELNDYIDNYSEIIIYATFITSSGAEYMIAPYHISNKDYAKRGYIHAISANVDASVGMTISVSNNKIFINSKNNLGSYVKVIINRIVGRNGELPTYLEGGEL